MKKKSFILFLILMVFLVLPLVSAIDSDKDGIPDDQDRYPNDFDNDGMPDSWEIKNGLSYDIVDHSLDNDNDGMSNYEEYTKGTDPNSADSDGDGTNDYIEIQNGTDPLSPDYTIWPLIITPLLIILFVIGLYLIHKYELDIKLKPYLDNIFSKKDKSKPEYKKQLPYEQPEILFRSLEQEKKEKEKQFLKMTKAFGAGQQTPTNFINRPARFPIKNSNRNDAFEKLRLFR
jgi:hypothetical protein